MDFEMLSGSSNPMMLLLGCVMALAMCTLYIFFAWVLPIKKIRDKDTSKTSKGGYGFMLFLFGICPILYFIYSMMKGRMSGGNANSPNSGGAPVPTGPTMNNKVAVLKGQNIAQNVKANTPSAIAGGTHPVVPA